jgi:hypothetical protein
MAKMIDTTVRPVGVLILVINVTSVTTTVAGKRTVTLNLKPSTAPIAHARSAATIGIEALPLPPRPAQFSGPVCERSCSLFVPLAPSSYVNHEENLYIGQFVLAKRHLKVSAKPRSNRRCCQVAILSVTTDYWAAPLIRVLTKQRIVRDSF